MKEERLFLLGIKLAANNELPQSRRRRCIRDVFCNFLSQPD